MKTDSSRNTFDPLKHFSSVRMQQGRVQIDADSNEQIDIVNHRVKAEASDVIGLCGAPIHYPGFQITKAVDELTEEQAKPDKTLASKASAMIQAKRANPDFLISPGRYYVDGILCENEHLISYLSQSTQADLPNPAPIGKGLYLVYLDVWQRLLTALDDPSIREIALGGPDTATRAKTVWQVKCLRLVDAGGNPLDAGNCLTTFAGYEKLIAPTDGKLAARAKRDEASTDACLVSPTAGYMGLENQFYRIEIHDGGAALDVAGASSNKVKAQEGKTTFKWSRDNGIVVTAIKSIDSTNKKVTVHDRGPDDTLGFQEGQWVELSDDSLELNGLPGQLAQITEIDKAGNVITLNVTPSLVVSQDAKLPDRHPKLRRWDGVGAVQYDSKTPENSFLDLELGVQVRFFQGQFKTGDYWTFPARTATADTQVGNIVWPQDAGKGPIPQLPFGIEHHYCRLAMLHWNGNTFDVVQDCRHLFPPITELTSLFYVGGDGQEVMPDLTQLALPLVPRPLEKQLVVGVSNGQWPVKNARVCFRIVGGSGRISAPAQAGNTINIMTDEHGLAACDWQLDSKTQTQQVEATLHTTADLKEPNDRTIGLPVNFTANLSVARQVAYDPGECGTLREQGTVQMALSRLSELRSLYKISGDGQEIMPAEKVAPFPLKVMVASPCGPVTDSKFLVTFRIVEPEKGAKIVESEKGASGGLVIRAEGGEGSKTLSVVRGKDGFWTCNWQPDGKMPFQEVEASIQSDDKRLPTTPPTTVRFSLNLSTADHVAYSPGDCGSLKNSDTVQKAIDQLSRLNSIYKISGDAQQFMVSDNVPPLKVLVASPCGPVTDDKFLVTFRIVEPEKGAGSGGLRPDDGVVSKSCNVVRGKDGFWTCFWEPDGKMPFQEVEASIKGDATTPPMTVRFSLNLSKADHVRYTPGDCNLLKASDTVQKAIDQLAQAASLYEVSGNNQIVIPAKSVLGLTVLAANKCGPVREQRISFRVISGGGKVEPAEVVTKDDGMATTSWTIGPRDQQNQQVEARSTDSKIPTAPPNSVLFNAYFSQAGNVLYDPNPRECPELVEAKVTTVQAALDALCQRGKTEDKPPEEGIHILDVRTGTQALLNDTLVPVSRLADGITIFCDKPIAPSIAYGNPGVKSSFPLVAPKPTCFVTLDLPSPLEIFGFGSQGTGTFGFHPLILASNVELVKDAAAKATAIRWFLTSSSREWLAGLFGQGTFPGGSRLFRVTDRVLVHLTLKGNFIVSSTAPEMWLDGEAFASTQGDRLDLRFPKVPTGDGRRGGDFEMWFYLFSGLILQVDVGGNGIVGTALDASGKGVSGVDVTATMTSQSTTPAVTAKTDGNGKFQLPKTVKGVYQVSAKRGTDLWADREVVVP